MSPPTNGRYRSSPSSTGTVPKSNSTMNGNRSRGQESQANADSFQSSIRNQNLERMLKDQQAKLRSLENQQNNPDLAGNLAELREKLRILQNAELNGGSDYGNGSHRATPRWQPTHEEDDDDEADELLLNAVGNLRIRDLQNHIRILNQSKMKPKNSVEQQLRSENSRLKIAFENQQGQIQQLTQSLNQCFQALLTIQRDVATLQHNFEESSSKQSAANNHLEDNLDSVSQQRDYDNPSWDFDFPRHSGDTSSRPSNDPWNNYFAESRLMTTGSESGLSTGALNNTVPPGMRANNYWDNFRSFSRQNRLQSSNLAGLSPVVAQVTPRQVQPTLHLPHSPIRNANNSTTSDPLMDAPEPYFSTGRPRRKQKINREHNVSGTRPEAAMVFPMPQQQQQPVHHHPRQNQVQPIHQQLLNPMVTSIKRYFRSQFS